MGFWDDLFGTKNYKITDPKDHTLAYVEDGRILDEKGNNVTGYIEGNKILGPDGENKKLYVEDGKVYDYRSDRVVGYIDKDAKAIRDKNDNVLVYYYDD